MKPIRWSALALALSTSLWLAGCPQEDDYDFPGEGEQERERIEEPRDGGYQDEPRGAEELDPDGDGVGGGRPPGGTPPPDTPPAGGVDEESGIPPVPNETGDPLYRDRGATGGGETPTPQQPQRDQIQPGQ